MIFSLFFFSALTSSIALGQLTDSDFNSHKFYVDLAGPMAGLVAYKDIEFDVNVVGSQKSVKFTEIYQGSENGKCKGTWGLVIGRGFQTLKISDIHCESGSGPFQVEITLPDTVTVSDLYLKGKIAKADSSLFGKIKVNVRAVEKQFSSLPTFVTYLKCISTDPAQNLELIGFLDSSAILAETPAKSALMNIGISSDIPEVTEEEIILVSGKVNAVPEGYLNFEGQRFPFGVGGPSIDYSLKFIRPIPQAEATYELELKIVALGDSNVYRLSCEAAM